MKLRTALAAVLAAGLASTIAYSAGYFPGFPIVGGAAYCDGSSVAGVPGTTAVCNVTVPAGPSSMTGNETAPFDTNLTQGQTPATVLIPSGLLTAGAGSGDDTNALIGTDFGQALWQRGTTPLSNATPVTAAMGADGWYNIELGTSAASITVSKQTGAADIPSNSLASARVQRVAAQTATPTICTGQLVPDVDASQFPGKTAIFAVDILAGGNFSPVNGSVNLIIAYHSAADATSAATNGQGTNTATFASSTGSPLVQNISNYTEAVNTVIPISTTWTRYSVAAAIPTLVPGTATQVLGIGVKICWTTAGTAGTNDFVEFTKAQLEARVGTSIGPSKYVHNSLAYEYGLETARYYQITEAGVGTPFYATGYIPATGIGQVMVQFPTLMRITPVTSPITTGGFKFLVAGTATATTLVTTGTTNTTPRTAGLGGPAGAATAGQGTILTGNSGTGVLGFSAEP